MQEPGMEASTRRPCRDWRTSGKHQNAAGGSTVVRPLWLYVFFSPGLIEYCRGVAGDHQLFIGGDAPDRHRAAHRGERIAVGVVARGVELDAQVLEPCADLR